MPPHRLVIAIAVFGIIAGIASVGRDNGKLTSRTTAALNEPGQPSQATTRSPLDETMKDASTPSSPTTLGNTGTEPASTQLATSVQAPNFESRDDFSAQEHSISSDDSSVTHLATSQDPVASSAIKTTPAMSPSEAQLIIAEKDDAAIYFANACLFMDLRDRLTEVTATAVWEPLPENVAYTTQLRLLRQGQERVLRLGDAWIIENDSYAILDDDAIGEINQLIGMRAGDATSSDGVANMRRTVLRDGYIDSVHRLQCP